MVVGVEDDRVLEVWLDVTSDPLPLGIQKGSGGEPDAINDDGVIVGDLSNGPPTIWKPVRNGSGAITSYERHTLPMLAGATGGGALSINSSGLIAGYLAFGDTFHGVIWRTSNDD